MCSENTQRRSPEATMLLSADDRRGGRPLMGDAPSSSLHVRLAPHIHDAVCRRALREKRTISEVIREALARDFGITI